MPEPTRPDRGRGEEGAEHVDAPAEAPDSTVEPDSTEPEAAVKPTDDGDAPDADEVAPDEVAPDEVAADEPAGRVVDASEAPDPDPDPDPEPDADEAPDSDADEAPDVDEVPDPDEADEPVAGEPARTGAVDDDPAARHEATADDGPAAAAPLAPASGRERLMAALTQPSRSQVVVGVLLALVGFGAIVQVRDNSADDSYAGLRESELVEVLDGLTGTAERARDEIDRLRSTKEELTSETTARRAALAEAQQRLTTLNILAGVVPVTGPGIRITITPGTTPVALGQLLDTVQELRTAGAEAIEFNDQIRVVAESSFDASSSPIGLQLDGTLLTEPYMIEAIGDPHVLEAGVRLAGGPVEVMEGEGATVGIEILDSVDVESVRDPVRLPHATATE